MAVVLPEAPARLNRSASELGSTTTERLGAQFAGAFEDNPVPLVMRLNDLASANRRGQFIPRADAQRIAEQNGAMLDLPGDGVSSEALDIMIESALKRQRRQAVIESAPQGMGVAAAGFVTELGAGLLDPAGFALNFVPVVGQSTRLALATNSARVSTRLGARTAVGAIEGAVGQAMVEPLTGYTYRQEGREYGAMDAATNVAFGTVLGSAAHNILGGGGDLWRTFRGEAHPWSLPGTIPLPPDVPVLPDATPDPLQGQGAIYGAQTKVKIGDAYQPARWAVVDAADVEATMEKADNQFRDRTRAASGAQIEAIARDIDFEYLNAHPDMASGAPTLSRDGKIIGGNGRAAAISMAYDLPSGMAYSGPMRERLTEWGVRPEQVAGMKKPMLVRVLEGDVDVRAAAIASNETGTLKMSALEQAKVDGERLGRVDLVAGAEGRLDIAENRGAIRRWVEQFPESERASLMDASGNLSAEGSRRLQNAALHQAFGDSPLLARMVDSKDPGMGRVSSALLRASGKIAEVRGAVARGDLHDVDLGPDIVAAVERLAWLRDQGMTVEMYLRQGDLLGDGLSPEARRLLAFLGENMDSARRMADGLTRFYEAVEAAGDPKQADMFGESVAPDKGALLDQALADAESDRSTAAAKMDAASPATREAALVTASSQMLEGKMPDVQALVDADPAIGQATFADIEATAKRMEQPEALRAADPVASQQVAERAASIPKAWGSETAKAERERVGAELQMLEAAQGDAWKYARAKESGTDTPLQDPVLLRESLATSFGASTDAILRAGQVEIVGKVSDLPARSDGAAHPIDVSAMTAADGRVWIVAENASPAMARGLVLHEVGVHVGLEPMLGRQGFDDVLAQVDRLLESGDDVALLARSAVPEDTPSHLVREETLAYLVQHHPELPLVQRILAAVRAWAYKTFEFARDRMELAAADLQALAVAAVRRVARDAEARRGVGPDIRYSRGPIEVPNSKDDLAPFREAEARAEKYADAVRAAAARWGSDVEMRAAIEKASGGEIVGREVEELIDALKAKHREVVTGLRKLAAGSQAQDMAASLQDAAMRAADMLAEAEVRAAAVEHRNAMLSLAARTRALSYVKANFVGREIEGLKALVAGTEFLREGGRSSAALEIKQFEGAWMGGIVNDLTKAGLWEHFARDAYAADVARALWQHSLPEPDFSGIHPDAKKIADVLTRYQSDARATQNRFGAWIGDLSGWMYRQAHDMHKMRKAGSSGWKDFVRTRLDWERIREQLGVVDAEKFDTEAFLDAAWLDLSNGQHFKPDSITEIKASVGPSNIAKRVSQSRALHWKDADAAFGYLQAFGPGEGSLAETVLGGFHGSAKAAGLMKVFGPNYEANIKAVADQLQQDLLGTPQGDSWRSQSKEVMDLLHHVDGSLSIPHNALGAKIGGGLRAWQSMAKLGAAVVSQISDVPVFAASIAHRFDVGLLPGLRDAMSGLLQGRSKGERLEILHECGYFYESLARQTFARFDPASDMHGAMSAAMEKFFKWGGITWWTETLRSTAVLTTARRLGDVHRKGFDALPKATRDMLGLYKIGAGRWDLLRMAATREADGAVYMTAEGVRAVPDAAISSYLKASGRPVSGAAVANTRTDLEASMRSLFLDQSEYAVLEPSARSRQVLLRGSQAGTWQGEAFRMFAQFKSFPVVYAQKVFGREIQGRGYDTLGQYLRSGDTKAFGAFLGLMVSLTASGYLAGMAKDLLKLRSPKPVDDPRTWIAAFMQGGSLGIYGDFLFGQMNRVGSGAMETLAGPVPSALLGGRGLYGLLSDTVWGTVGKAVEGEDVEPADLGAKWLRYAENNTPFMNLHVLRPALNALLFWKLEEALNPGSLRRAEKRLQKETGSTMFVSPSEFVR